MIRFKAYAFGEFPFLFFYLLSHACSNVVESLSIRFVFSCIEITNARTYANQPVLLTLYGDVLFVLNLFLCDRGSKIDLTNLSIH